MSPALPRRAIALARSARSPYSISIPPLWLVAHGIRIRANFRSQAARESSSTHAQFENGAQRARLRARKHGEILRVAGGRGRKLPAGPSVWICGDCHLGNLGPLADADGHVDVQIRDLDQTVIGNPVHDL